MDITSRILLSLWGVFMIGTLFGSVSMWLQWKRKIPWVNYVCLLLSCLSSTLFAVLYLAPHLIALSKGE